MQVASLCYTVEPALAGSGRFSQDDAIELQLFELEQKIQRQAHTLANKHCSSFREERCVMSKEDLARFKSADAKFLALQHRKAFKLHCWMKWLLNWMTIKPCSLQESWKELNEISPDKVWVQVQDSLHNLLQTMYLSKDIMLVSQNSEHNGVCQCNLRLTSLTNRMCPSLTGALPDLTGNEHGKIVAAQRPPHPPALLPDGKDTKNHIDGTNCVLSLQNARTNTQTITGRQWIS